MIQKIRKALLVGSAWVAIVSFALFSILDTIYVSYPRVPEHALGLVVPHDVKGITVYITEQQAEAIHWVGWILMMSGALLVVSMFLNLKWPLSKAR